jgi:hypothetical protein
MPLVRARCLIVHDNEPLPPPEVLLSTLRACSATQVARVVPASAQCVSVLLTAPHNVLSTPALHPYNLSHRIAPQRCESARMEGLVRAVQHAVSAVNRHHDPPLASLAA